MQPQGPAGQVVHGELEAQHVHDVAAVEAAQQGQEAQVGRLLLEGVQDQVQHAVRLMDTEKKVINVASEYRPKTQALQK
jgi:hypothetical protein